MTTITIRQHIYTEMEKYLENMCADHTIGYKDLFWYHAGKADACRELLEEIFSFDERHASEHIKAMWDIMDKNW